MKKRHTASLKSIAEGEKLLDKEKLGKCSMLCKLERANMTLAADKLG